jgi:hypothetical protein
MSDLELKIDKKDLDKLFRKLSAVNEEATIRQSLSQATFLLSAWSRMNRFRVGSYAKKDVHPTMLTRRSTGGYRDRIFGQTPGQVVRQGNDYVAMFGTNMRSKRGFSYPTLHEFGGRFHPPRPVLTPAIKDRKNKQEVLGLFLKNIKKALKQK